MITKTAKSLKACLPVLFAILFILIFYPQSASAGEGYAYFTYNGSIIFELTPEMAGKDISAHVTCYGRFYATVAAYEGGVMKGAAVSQSGEGNGEIIIFNGIKVPTGTDACVKIFYWEDFQTMAPLKPASVLQYPAVSGAQLAPVTELRWDITDDYLKIKYNDKSIDWANTESVTLTISDDGGRTWRNPLIITEYDHGDIYAYYWCDPDSSEYMVKYDAIAKYGSGMRNRSELLPMKLIANNVLPPPNLSYMRYVNGAYEIIGDFKAGIWYRLYNNGTTLFESMSTGDRNIIKFTNPLQYSSLSVKGYNISVDGDSAFFKYSNLETVQRTEYIPVTTSIKITGADPVLVSKNDYNLILHYNAELADQYGFPMGDTSTRFDWKIKTPVNGISMSGVNSSGIYNGVSATLVVTSNLAENGVLAITASYGSISAEKQIAIDAYTAVATSIEMYRTTYSNAGNNILRGTSTGLSYKIYDQRGQTMNIINRGSILWSIEDNPAGVSYYPFMSNNDVSITVDEIYTGSGFNVMMEYQGVAESYWVNVTDASALLITGGTGSEYVMNYNDVSEPFTARPTDAFGNTLGEIAPVWSISPAVAGVSINSEGVVTVDSSCTADYFNIRAEYNGLPGGRSIYLRQEMYGICGKFHIKVNNQTTRYELDGTIFSNAYSGYTLVELYNGSKLESSRYINFEPKKKYNVFSSINFEHFSSTGSNDIYLLINGVKYQMDKSTGVTINSMGLDMSIK